MHKTDLFPRDFLANGGYSADSKGIDNEVHSCDLKQYGNQLFRNNPFAADRMSQQKFRCFVFFFFAENTNGTKSCKKCTAKSQNIAALNSVKPDERSEIQTIHTERLGKRTHRGEHIVDTVHLSLHFREQKNADCKKESNRSRPYQKRNFALFQFVLYKSHTLSPSFS